MQSFGATPAVDSVRRKRRVMALSIATFALLGHESRNVPKAEGGFRIRILFHFRTLMSAKTAGHALFDLESRPSVGNRISVMAIGGTFLWPFTFGMSTPIVSFDSILPKTSESWYHFTSSCSVVHFVRLT